MKNAQTITPLSRVLSLIRGELTSEVRNIDLNKVTIKF